tara:strand:+ start:105 stop:356 length:252 start_codon:yes stop_codon:yes gene_type:complete
MYSHESEVKIENEECESFLDVGRKKRENKECTEERELSRSSVWVKACIMLRKAFCLGRRNFSGIVPLDVNNGKKQGQVRQSSQ